MRDTRSVSVALLLTCASLLGCKISVVSGPTEVEVGDTVAYEVEIHPTSGLGGEPPGASR